MSHWKLKSIENTESAKALTGKTKFCSSVHCSYYSNVQLMFHILSFHYEKSTSEIEIVRKKGASQNKGTHNWLISFFKIEIAKINFMAVADFSNYIGELKAARVNSDYKNVTISPLNANKCIDLSRLVNEILTDNFRT